MLCFCRKKIEQMNKCMVFWLMRTRIIIALQFYISKWSSELNLLPPPFFYSKSWSSAFSLAWTNFTMQLIKYSMNKVKDICLKLKFNKNIHLQNILGWRKCIGKNFHRFILHVFWRNVSICKCGFHHIFRWNL